MSLNNIELPPLLVSGLYARTLIGEAEEPQSMLQPEPVAAPASPPATKKKPAAPGFKMLGNNQEKVLIAVRYPDFAHLPDEQLDFLQTLLKACSLGLNDVALINLHQYQDLSYSDITQSLHTKTVLLFGITAAEFGFPFEVPPYQVQSFAGLKMVHAPALHDLKDNVNEKGKLWKALKIIFNI